MHFYRLIRAQKGLLNTVSKFNNLGFSYEAIESTIIHRTCRPSTKKDMQLQQVMGRRHQNTWNRNLGKKINRNFALIFIQLWFQNSVFWRNLRFWRYRGYVGHVCIL